MYSKNKGSVYQQTVLTPPPGYDGSRFRGRSDGRDDAFPLYESQKRPQKRIMTHVSTPPYESDTESCVESEYDESAVSESIEADSPEIRSNTEDSSPLSLLAPILKRIGKEELLIIALIIILAGEKDSLDTDTILLLALLLCAA